MSNSNALNNERLINFKSVVQSVAGTLFPAPMCILCEQILATGRRICEPCVNQLPWCDTYCHHCGEAVPLENFCGACQKDPPFFNRLWVAFDYLFPIDQLVRSGKFANKLSHLALLAELFILMRTKQGLPMPQLLLPVPLHPKRLRARGYNQAVELARFMGRQWGIPVDLNSVVRTKNTLAQTQLSAKMRVNNMKQAFTLKCAIPHSSIAIVDDVWTTGSTIKSLCRTLHQAGVKELEVFCLAKAIH